MLEAMVTSKYWENKEQMLPHMRFDKVDEHLENGTSLLLH